MTDFKGKPRKKGLWIDPQPFFHARAYSAAASPSGAK